MAGAFSFAFFLCIPFSHADIIVYADQKGTPYFSDRPVEGLKAKKVIKTRFKPVFRPNKERFSPAIHSASDAFGVDPELVSRVIEAESDFDPYAVSNKGAHGLMQLRPATASLYNVQDLYDPSENIHGGVRHLKHLIVKYHGNLRLALAAYNAGENAVLKYDGVPPFPETMHYVNKILYRYRGTGMVVKGRIYTYPGKNGSILITDTPFGIERADLR